MLTRSNACVGFLRREAICLRLLIVYVEIGRAVSLGDVTVKYGLKFILSNWRLDSQNMISGGEKGASAVSSSRNSSTLLPTFLAISGIPIYFTFFRWRYAAFYHMEKQTQSRSSGRKIWVALQMKCERISSSDGRAVEACT